MLYGIKEFKLPLAGTELDCIRFGRGPKPLVMLQGLNTRGIRGSGLSLAWMYRCFAPDYTVYLFDRRPNVAPGITVEALAADVAAAMDALGLARAHVLGVSQGGMIAQYLALRRPDLVEKLVLAVTACRTGPELEDAVETWVDQTGRGDWKALVTHMAGVMYSPAYLKRYKPLLPLLALVQKPRDRSRFITLARSCLTCRMAEQLHAIRCPVLVIGGEQDMALGHEASLEIVGQIPGAQLKLYPQWGHGLYEEAPDFNQTVLDFIRRR